MRRIHFIGRVILTLLSLSMCIGTTWAQLFDRSPTPVQLLVEPERDVIRAMTDARTAIQKKQFHVAAQLLQVVLDKPEDSFVERDFLEDRGNRGGIRKEAIRLLMSMPAEGQGAYELAVGVAAQQLLNSALENDDPDGIAEVVRRYVATIAGYEATMLLAARAADGNRPLEAALLLETIRGHSRRTTQLPLMRAIYWTRAGRVSRGLAALRELRRLEKTGKIRIAGRDVTLPTEEEDSTRWLQSLAVRNAEPTEVETWSMQGGGPARNSSGAPASPAGGNAWRISSFEHVTLEGRVADDLRHRERLQDALDKVLQSLFEENRPVLAAAQPLVIGDTVVYRTVADVTAVNLQSGELLWRSALTDQSLARLMNYRSFDPRARYGRGPLTLEAHVERRVFRDNAAGTLSTDGKTVFALEELDNNANISLNVLGVSESRPANKLVGYDLAGGRLLWEVGGPIGAHPPELASRYYLGPPLPMHDRLYAIAEAQGALELVVMSQDADRHAVHLDWSQTLIATDPPLPGHPLRRLSGLSPSYADGILICPTSSGAVVAVDAVHRSLLWGFQYPTSVRPEVRNVDFAMRERSLAVEARLQETDKAGRWMDNTALITDGKVLISPRDSDSLFCLDLVDGHEIWRVHRDDWMYVACEFEGRVILVGRHGVGAFQLSDGELIESFNVEDVVASGRGIRIGSSYFLPSASGEIATIDLRSGVVVARSKLMANVVPGNLAVGSGTIVSQSAGQLMGFFSQASIEQQIEKLKTDPLDPRALTLRGELRLQRGEEAAGLADLRQSLKQKPDPYTKAVLATALLAGARTKPEEVRERVEELEAITDDPQQRNEYLQLYAQVLETSGDRRGAFVQLLRLAETVKFLDTLKPVEVGYSVRSDRLIRSRLIEMYSAASPEEKVHLDQALEQYLRTAATAAVDVDRLGQILRFVGGLAASETILLQSILQKEGLDLQKRLEMLRPFARSIDRDVAAQAAAWQCRELINSEQWHAAAPLVEQLQTEFADRELQNGKTGRTLAEEWLKIDELRRLIVAKSVWPDGPIEVRRVAGQPPASRRSSFPAEVVATSGAQLAGWSFETDLEGLMLSGRDPSGAVRWKVPLPNEGDFNDADLRSARYPCQILIRDNWLVISRLTYFAVIDVSVNRLPRVAWQQLLKPSNVATADLLNPPGRNVRFGGRPTSFIGRVIGMTQESVIYSIGSKLLAGDLDTGRLVWSRQNSIPVQSESTADDRLVSVVASGNVALFRTLDGSRMARRPIQSNSLIWCQGSRQLVFRVVEAGITFELRDAGSDSVIWSHECPADTQATVVGDQDVAFLLPTGELQMVRLADKKEKYRSDLPLKLGNRDKSWFTIQRCPDRDIILGGQRIGIQVDPVGTQMQTTFEGHVCAVSSIDGRQLWTTTVQKGAYDKTQPSDLPVLLLSARTLEADQQRQNPFAPSYRMVAEIIDKRTGLKIYSTDESTYEPSPRLVSDFDHQQIVADFHNWYLELSFPIGKAKSEQ